MVLERILPLLAPGGLILVEDICVTSEVTGDVPGIRASQRARAYARTLAGQDATYASGLSDFFKKHGLRVGEHHVVLPINPLSVGESSLTLRRRVFAHR